MKTLSRLTIPHPFIALFGSGSSVHDISESDLACIKAHAFTITLNYAPIHLNGHLNMWSDRKVSDFLENHYSQAPKECLLLAQEGRVNGKLNEKVDFWFNRSKENLKGNYTLVWALQLLKRYFPNKPILLFGVDMYCTHEKEAKWYDRYIDYDRKRKGQHVRLTHTLRQCALQLQQHIPKTGVYNCNLSSQLDHFEKKDWRSLFHLKVLHLCSSSLAGAPVHLSQIINKYTLCDSKTILKKGFNSKDLNRLSWDYDLISPSRAELEEAIEWADFIHYHQRIFPAKINGKPSVIQYHSPPNGYRPEETHAEWNGRKMVIAQYHPRYYTDASIVPNLIDIWDEKFLPEPKLPAPITIFYSWASEKKGGWSDKGSIQTISTLNRIKSTYGSQVSIKVLHNNPYERCLEEKRKAHICIDECVTGSYHLQSLEGCSVGSLTLNNMDDETLNFMKVVSGTSTHPFVKSDSEVLYNKLCSIIENRAELAKIGSLARHWMETYWDPRKLVFQYIHAYFNIIHQDYYAPKNITPLTTQNGSNHSHNGPINGKIKVGARKPKATLCQNHPPYTASVRRGRSIEELWRKFEGENIYIFGGGPSLLKVNPEDFRDKICFGINYSFEKMPYMDYILVHEIETYESIRQVIDNKKFLLPETLVRHYYADKRNKDSPHRIPTENPEAYIYPIQNPYEKNISAKDIRLTKNANIFTWSCTTHSAIHLAAYMGAKNIFLIGVDYKLFADGKVHFDTNHNLIYGEQNWNVNQKHKFGDEWIAKELKKYAVNVVNLSGQYIAKLEPKNVQGEPGDKSMCGKYVQGIGKASKVAKTAERSSLLKSLFGCPLIGTFNIETSEDIIGIKPTLEKDIHRFTFLKIGLPSGDYRYGWSYQFEGSRQKGNILEVYTKNALPEEYKKQPLTLNFYSKWSKEKILEWQKGKYWFQGFDWLPIQKADSRLLWSYMEHENYAQKQVLDYGSHYGYFAFQASKQGAIVEAIDANNFHIEMAKTINEHIEQQDILFRKGETLPEGNYDYIFELSVYHWIDEYYTHIAQHLEELKKRCKVLYLELINPPLKGKLSQHEVDAIVGGQKLLHYKHKVRRMRTLYRVEGYL
jgi:2-polyprenyl-3-methyl-5-hydroxy-6-metoxy-1,4-benzoquinol methylase